MYRKLFLIFIFCFSFVLLVSPASADEEGCEDPYQIIADMTDAIDDEINSRTIRSRTEGQLNRCERKVPDALNGDARSLSYAIRYVEKFKMYVNRYDRTGDIDGELADWLLNKADDLIYSLTCVDCPSELRVFTTSESGDGDIGGVSGADDICQGLADDAGLNGTFKAWISDSATGPADRWVTDHDLSYYTIGDSLVADDWDDLTHSAGSSDDYLANPIDEDENGDPVPYDEGEGGPWPLVWTDTDPEGYPVSGGAANCEDWTAGGGEAGGVFGVFLEVDEGWTVWSDEWCGEDLHLYCFEQVAEDCVDISEEDFIK